ncbi:hypothetical protein BKA93DRAFT_237948 [Sparassis latifolia]
MYVSLLRHPIRTRIINPPRWIPTVVRFWHLFIPILVRFGLPFSLAVASTRHPALAYTSLPSRIARTRRRTDIYETRIYILQSHEFSPIFMRGGLLRSATRGSGSPGQEEVLVRPFDEEAAPEMSEGPMGAFPDSRCEFSGDMIAPVCGDGAPPFHPPESRCRRLRDAVSLTAKRVRSHCGVVQGNS